MAQSLVTVETVRDYLASRGGVVKNVELVRHFRLFLQQEDPERKAQARTLFKDYVNAIATIKLENGEKYLILKPHLQQEMGVTSGTKPPPLPPVELSDMSDGGILSALSPMLFPTPTQQNPPPSSENPAPPMGHSQPPPPAASQEPRSPLQSMQQQSFPVLSVTPPSSGSLPRAYHHPTEPRAALKQGSAPPPPTARDSPTANERADIKKMSASTDSLEKSGGLQSSVTKRIKAANSMARRSGSFNYADYRNSAAGRPPVASPSGRSSPRGKGRVNIPAGPGFDERRSVFENQTRRITLTPQQRRKAGTSLQLSIKNFGGSRDSNLAVVGTEGANNEWDDTSSINTSGSAMEYEGLDPTEHEWINASTDADVDTIHRLLMVDASLVNRKDFFMYTAVHWAALHGRVDMITGLMINGALLDIKSGYTPLHLAAQRGHDNVIRCLVKEHGARTDIRENSGRLPIDMLKSTASEESRRILETGLKDYGLRRKPVAEARRISGARKGSGTGGGVGQLAGAKMWSSMGDMLEGEDETDEKKKKKNRNPSILRRLSMRREKRKAYLSEIYEPGDNDSPSLDRRKQNRNRVQSDMFSYAV